MAGHLVLRVAKRNLNRLESSTNLGINGWSDYGVEPDIESDEIITVVSKPLTEITRYGTTVAWLMDLSQSIFGKRLDVNTDGELWAGPHDGMEQDFEEQTITTAQLKAWTYEYRPKDALFPPCRPVRIFSLSRYWGGKQPALKPKVPKKDRNQVHFGGNVRLRDKRCGISTLSSNVVASHLIPNCLPHGAIMMILQRHNPDGNIPFSTSNWGKNGNDSNNDEKIGILAFSALDKLIDNFSLGFYCPDPKHYPDNYEVHHFPSLQSPGEYNVLGIKHEDYANVPGVVNHLAPLHRHRVTFADRTVNGKVLQRVMHAATRWHYMQCVLKHLSNAGEHGYMVW